MIPGIFKWSVVHPLFNPSLEFHLLNLSTPLSLTLPTPASSPYRTWGWVYLQYADVGRIQALLLALHLTTRTHRVLLTMTTRKPSTTVNSIPVVILLALGTGRTQPCLLTTPNQTQALSATAKTSAR